MYLDRYTFKNTCALIMMYRLYVFCANTIFRIYKTFSNMWMLVKYVFIEFFVQKSFLKIFPFLFINENNWIIIFYYIYIFNFLFFLFNISYFIILKHIKFHWEFYKIKYFNKTFRIIKKSEIIKNFLFIKRRLHNFLFF